MEDQIKSQQNQKEELRFEVFKIIWHKFSNFFLDDKVQKKEKINRLLKITNFQFMTKNKFDFDNLNASLIHHFLSQLVQIKQLAFQMIPDHKFGKNVVINISKGYSQLINLNELSIYINKGNNIQYEGFKSIFVGLNNLINLQILTICIFKNDIDEYDFKDLLISFANLQQLQNLKIHLVEVNLNTHCYKHLGHGIGKLVKLETLDLCILKNDIDEYDLKDLSIGIGNIQQLKNLKIRLAQVNLNMQCYKHFSQGICKLAKLEKLDLCIFRIDIDFKDLSICFANLQQLQNLKIHLDEVNLNTQCYKHLGQGIGKLAKLETLDLSFTQNTEFSYEDWFQFSEGFKLNTNCKNMYLKFIYSSIRLECLKQIYYYFQDKTSLDKLQIYFSNQMLNYSDVNQSLSDLSECFKDLSNIKEINFNTDFNSEDIVIKFRQEFRNFVNLTTLSIQIIKKNSQFQFFIDVLLSSIHQILQLSELSIKICIEVNLIEEESLNIFYALNKCTQLKRLSLDIKSPQQFYFIALLSNLRQLQKYCLIDKLYFTRCIHSQNIISISLYSEDKLYIGIEGMKALAFSFNILNEIKILQISFYQYNQINEEGMNIFMNQLSKLPKLNRATFNFYYICQKFYQSFGNGLKKLEYLDDLTIIIQRNKFLEQASLQTILIGISQVKTLQRLYLIIDTFNKLIKSEIQNQPEKYFQNSNLNQIQLRFSEYNAILLDQSILYSWTKEIKSLEHLNIEIEQYQVNPKTSKDNIKSTKDNLISTKNNDLSNTFFIQYLEQMQNVSTINLQIKNSNHLFFSYESNQILIKSLKIFKLDINIESNIEAKLNQTLKTLIHLESLKVNIESKSICEKGFQNLMNSIKHLNKLNSLHLDFYRYNYTWLNKNEINSILQVIRQLKQLKYLYLERIKKIDSKYIQNIQRKSIKLVQLKIYFRK